VVTPITRTQIDQRAAGTPAPVEEDEAYRKAMKRAGRLLAARSRSEHEVRDRLGRAGFEAGVVDRVVDRLRDLKLVDDLAFARQWVAERSVSRGPVLLADELRAKGVAEDTVQEALEAARRDEMTAAIERAGIWMARVADRPLHEQAARVQEMLLRRGFSHDAAEEAVKAVLPPEGWD
jgi:regulatory protein